MLLVALALTAAAACSGKSGGDADSQCQCPAGWICVVDVCVKECTGNADCPTGAVCGFDGLCVSRPDGLTPDDGVSVTPLDLQFGNLSAGEYEEREITIVNSGDDPLVVGQFAFVSTGGSQAFTLIAGDQEFTVLESPGNNMMLDSPLQIEPSANAKIKVRFQPLDAAPAAATLSIYFEDIQQTPAVMVSGNLSVPCMASAPSEISFGGIKVGQSTIAPLQIKACDDDPLEVYEVYVHEASSPCFTVDLSVFDPPPSPETPLIIPGGAVETVFIHFAPESINPVDGDGNLVLNEGAVVVVGNGFESTMEILVSGAGLDPTCPVPVITSDQGEELAPQTVLQLHGDQSYALEGEIEEWEWSVDQPAGSQSAFMPGADAANPTFDLNVTGKYTFYLSVKDTQNLWSDVPAFHEVVVNSNEAIRVELLWSNPDDPDKTDTGPEAGSDLDLHFLHPWAGGPDLDGNGEPDGWFDIPYDCFWFNAHPNWGSYEPEIDDDPGLDLADTDGWGPEIMNLVIPENVTYRVGAHYFDSHGFGPAYVTVRVYIHSQLVFEVADVMLQELDMWDVCTVEWPSGKVHVITDDVGQYQITSGYMSTYPFE